MIRTPPVEVGQELEIVIEGVGDKGDGFTKLNGYIIFVKDTQKDEKCRIKITRTLDKVGFGEKI